MNQDRTKKYKRATAIKVHINHLISGKYVKDDVNNYLETEFGVPISRVRILSTIVGKWMPNLENEAKSERVPQASITIDDGTETIRVKAWKDDIKILEDVEIGDIVDIIGRVREYEKETYITPEIIRKIDDPNWELVRELEIIEYLERIKSTAKTETKSVRSQQLDSDSSGVLVSDQIEKSIFKDKIVELINKLDEAKGVSINKLKEHANIPEIDFQDALTELINEGTIYQPNPGKYKIL
ncbi:MAG: hypothetical protein HWN66_08495 [Candidatus Helarchaeota archaeon]|nr:hypothetical protein [Candidatus Helarchaeota archaeon]